MNNYSESSNNSGQQSPNEQDKNHFNQANQQQVALVSNKKKEEAELRQLMTSHKTYSVSTIANNNFNQIMNHINLNLLTENYFIEGTEARKFYKKVYIVKTYLEKTYDRLSNLVRELKPSVEQNVQQLFVIGEQIKKLEKDLTIIIDENVMKCELSTCFNYSKKLNEFHEEIKKFRAFNEQQLQLIQECKDEQNQLVPVVMDDNDDEKSVQQRIFETLAYNQKLIDQGIEKISEMEIENSHCKLKIEQLQKHKESIEGDEKIYLARHKNLSNEIETFSLLINDDGQKAKELIEKNKQESEQELEKLKQENQEKLKESQDLTKIINEKVKKQICQLVNVNSFDMIQQQKSDISYIQGFHFIFVIDESGSVISCFNQIVEAFKIIINSRKHLNKDKVSIIQFDSSARTSYTCSSISEDFKLTCNGGGTNFTAAFEQASRELKMIGQKYQPILIFMTDGLADSKQSEKILEQMSNDSISRSLPLWTFCLGFNLSQSSKTTLDNLAKAGNGGQCVREVKGTKIQLSYVCENIQELPKCMNVIEKQVVLIDSNESLFETLSKRQSEFEEFQSERKRQLLRYSEEEYKRMNENYNRQLQLSLQNKDDQKKILQKTLQERYQEKQDLEEKIQETRDLLQQIDQDIIEQQKSIEKIDQALNGEQYKYIRDLQKSKEESTQLKDAKFIETVIKQQQEKGFLGDRKKLSQQGLLIKMITNDMAKQLEGIVIEVRKAIELISDDFGTILPRMKDTNQRQSDNIVLQQVGLQQLALDSEKSELDAQDLAKLIRVFLMGYNLEKHNSEEIISFFQRSIKSVQDLYYDILNISELERQKIVALASNNFAIKYIDPFLDQLIPSPNSEFDCPDFNGSISEKKNQFTKFANELRSKNQYNSNQNQINLLWKQIQIEEIEEKLYNEQDFVAQETLQNKLEKIQKEIVDLKVKLENPKKKLLRETLTNYYKDMRTDFSQKVQSYYQKNQRAKILDQYSLIVKILEPKIKSLLNGLQSFEK